MLKSSVFSTLFINWIPDLLDGISSKSVLFDCFEVQPTNRSKNNEIWSLSIKANWILGY